MGARHGGRQVVIASLPIPLRVQSVPFGLASGLASCACVFPNLLVDPERHLAEHLLSCDLTNLVLHSTLFFANKSLQKIVQYCFLGRLGEFFLHN